VGSPSECLEKSCYLKQHTMNDFESYGDDYLDHAEYAGPWEISLSKLVAFADSRFKNCEPWYVGREYGQRDGERSYGGPFKVTVFSFKPLSNKLYTGGLHARLYDGVRDWHPYCSAMLNQFRHPKEKRDRIRLIDVDGVVVFIDGMPLAPSLEEGVRMLADARASTRSKDKTRRKAPEGISTPQKTERPPR
jgi:hypothetical protein